MTNPYKYYNYPIYPHIDENNEVYFATVFHSKEISATSLAVEFPNEVIPIIFIPGIMGTRLKWTGSPDSEIIPAWHPPESAVPLGTLVKSRARSAAENQQLLNVNQTEVDDVSNAKGFYTQAKILFSKKSEKDIYAQAKARGWGQLYSKTYMPILQIMEDSCNGVFSVLDADNEATSDVTEVKVQPLNARWIRVLEMQNVTSYENPEKEHSNWLFDYGDKKKGTPGKSFGAQKDGFAELTQDEMKLFAKRAFYPVHAFGYNWLKSNRDAGKKLSEAINKITEQYSKLKFRGKAIICKHVIIVTHSMGGIVARCAISQDASLKEKVLGVIHGVMPATGAPATYKRLRAGFEGISSWVLGRNSAITTAIMAFSPGPLELLPFPNYNAAYDPVAGAGAKQHWLRASHVNGGAIRTAKPSYTDLGAGDFFETIYKPRDPKVWFRAVREDLLNPLGQDAEEAEEKVRLCEDDVKEAQVALENARLSQNRPLYLSAAERLKKNEKRLFEAKAEANAARQKAEAAVPKQEIDKDGESDESDYDMYLKTLWEVNITHSMLSNENEAASYHPQTYAYYEADPKRESWHEVCWQHVPYEVYTMGMHQATTVNYPPFHLRPNGLADKELSDTLKGQLCIEVDGGVQNFKVAAPEGSGDGTVPTCSGAAPTPFCRQIFRHGGKEAGHPSYDHQDSFSTDICIDVTLYSIAKIAIG